MKQYRPTQEDQVLAHLRTGAAITGMQALKLYGIFHLPRRIANLKEQGVYIQSAFVRVKDRYGRRVKVKQYWIA